MEVTSTAERLALICQSICDICANFGALSYFCLLTLRVLNYLFSFLLTWWNRVLLERPIVLQQVNRFPAFYGTRRFITVFTSARHLHLSCARLIQSMPSHPASWRSILLLYSYLRLGLPSSLFPSGFHTKPCTHLHIPHTCYMPRPIHSSRFVHPNNVGWGVQMLNVVTFVITRMTAVSACNSNLHEHMCMSLAG